MRLQIDEPEADSLEWFGVDALGEDWTAKIIIMEQTNTQTGTQDTTQQPETKRQAKNLANFGSTTTKRVAAPKPEELGQSGLSPKASLKESEAAIKLAFENARKAGATGVKGTLTFIKASA